MIPMNCPAMSVTWQTVQPPASNILTAGTSPGSISVPEATWMAALKYASPRMGKCSPPFRSQNVTHGKPSLLPAGYQMASMPFISPTMAGGFRHLEAFSCMEICADQAAASVTDQLIAAPSTDRISPVT